MYDHLITEHFGCALQFLENLFHIFSNLLVLNVVFWVLSWLAICEEEFDLGFGVINEAED